MTTAVEERRVQSDGSEVVTPRLRTTARRVFFWLLIFVVLVTVAVVSLALAGTAQSTARLSATNPHPVGAEALIQVLRSDGVTVNTPRSLVGAVKDIGTDPSETTLVLYDQTSLLTPAQLESLRVAANYLVIIEPNYSALKFLAPGVAAAGVVNSTASANCTFPAARRAGTVSGLGKGYRIISKKYQEVGCFGESGVYSLVRGDYVDQTVTVLGSTTLLTNASIQRSGNAALALGLFGQTNHVVWYLPSLSDVSGVQQDGTLPNPPWVQLLIALAGLVLLTAAVWRGRRFGPIVVERMPVVVRSSETVEGRARLYQRASSGTHALDSLRIGAIGRLAALCGLPKRATIDEVVGAVSGVTGRSLLEVRNLLVDDVPAGDASLLRLSDGLQELERDVAVGIRPR